MTPNPIRFFVGRNQKIFGPLSIDEVEALRQSGQLSSYSWIWKEGDALWTAIDLPPPLPTNLPSYLPSSLASSLASSSASIAPPPLASAVAPAPRAVVLTAIAPHTYRVILFDRRNAISGWLVGASENGCEIRSDQNGPDPMFVSKESACINLHDTRTGESVKLNVRLGPVSREGKKWSYKMRWSRLPELIAA